MLFDLSPAWLGLLRGLGFTILLALLTFLGDAANLNGVVSSSVAMILSSLALAWEHSLEAKTGSSLFGMARKIS